MCIKNVLINTIQNHKKLTLKTIKNESLNSSSNLNSNNISLCAQCPYTDEICQWRVTLWGHCPLSDFIVPSASESRSWQTFTHLYISKCSQSQTHAVQLHRDLSSAGMLLMMDCCGFRKRGKNKAVTQQAVTDASPVNSSSPRLAALKKPNYCMGLWWLLDICDAKKRITFGKWTVQLKLKLMLMLN